MLATSIKTYTANAHATLEKVIITHLKAINSKQDYINILTYFYAFVNPLEEQIAHYLHSIFPGFDQRRNATKLLTDIQLLQPDQIFSPPSPIWVSWINNPYEAAGALYVLEGSTLGAVYISKMIAGKLNIQPCQGITYFSAYGDQTMDKWNSFKNWLNSFATSPQQKDQVISAADDTFKNFTLSIPSHV